METPDLLEREGELAALDALIAAAREGGRLLVIEGPPGIGKTRLLFEARARGGSAGLRVLAARGSELEQRFSYGVVRQLFEPLLASASAQERTELLAVAAGLAEPIFDPARIGDEPDADAPLAMLHGLFWLTANAADQRGLLVAIDDLHWCDPPSLRWLAYLLPRMEGLPLLIVAGLRPAEPGADVALLAGLTIDPLATVLRPAPLSERATGRLLSAVVSSDVDDVFRLSLHETSGGNPLFVRELTSAIAAEGIEPTAANAARLDDLGGRAVSRAVRVRLLQLATETTALARAVALLGDDAEPELAAALAGLGQETASEVAADLVRVEILRPGAPLGFVHPVVRAAVYAELSPVDRGRGHSRAARLLAESGAEPERVAAQLLLTTSTRDAWATEILRDAAQSALARGAPDSAVAYLRRALDEAPPREEGSVLYELGAAEARVADPQALDHLAAARAVTRDPRARCRIALTLGAALFTAGRAPEALDVLQDAIDELSGQAPELMRELQYLLIGVARFEPALYPLAVTQLERLRADAQQLGAGDEVGLANLASEATRAWLARDEAVGFGERALVGDGLLRGAPYPAFLYAVGALMSAERFDEAFRHCTEAMDQAQRRGLVVMCFASMYRARISFLRGALDDAAADADLCLNAIDLHGLEVGRPNAVAVLAMTLLERGDLDAARELVHSAPIGPTIESYAQTGLFEVRARLRLAEDDAARALDDLTSLGSFLERLGIQNPALSAWRSLMALALLSLGRRDEALASAHEELALSRRWGSPWVLGESLIATALVEGEAEGLALLREAAEVLESSQARLVRARALVELGSALRRANRRAEAREPLARGRELAAACGASPLAARAETELLATGARPRRIALSGVDSLTPSERRVAEMAAGRRTNREIARALFVTPKTVEVHLTSVYRKLDIGSRQELSRALVDADPRLPDSS